MTLDVIIERVKVDARFAMKIDAARLLILDGWSATLLLAPDQRTAVLLACRARS